jgi:hypothetical protein
MDYYEGDNNSVIGGTKLSVPALNKTASSMSFYAALEFCLHEI